MRDASFTFAEEFRQGLTDAAFYRIVRNVTASHTGSLLRRFRCKRGGLLIFRNADR